jgi:pimeloyl-ACP methyl ester carboxylesterase
MLAVAVATVVLTSGAVVARNGLAERDDADAARALARTRVDAARAVLERAETDLAAARAAVATYTAAAAVATDATARVVDREAAVVDAMARMRAAGAARDAATYNRAVDELLAAGDALDAALADLDLPFDDFAQAMQTLPTARCSGPAARTIRWVTYGRSGLECARLLVPLDYDHPGGAQIEVMVVRRPADDPERSMGPLLLEPGGPGASGVAFLRELPLVAPPELLRRFDLVAFDPRGVGHSTPVDCADDLDPLFDVDVTSSKKTTREQAVREVERVVRACEARSGELLQHVDSLSAARDIDRIRRGLGVDRISYLGYSYGTYLGALYAELFPEHLRAAVLDGPVDPDAYVDQPATYGAPAFDAELGAALDACEADPRCPFSGGDPRAAYQRLMVGLDDEPLVVGDRRLGRVLAELGVLTALYDGEDGWPDLLEALARAAAGDGAALLDLSDTYTGRRPDGSYSNETEAHSAISCTDATERTNRERTRMAVRYLDDHPDHFEALGVVLSLPCVFWPAPTIGDRVPTIDGEGAPPILVVAGERDPATPLDGAQTLVDALDSARLVRWAGSGHTSLGRSQCIDDVVVAYLVDLDLPQGEQPCPPE